jgi:hypothetical protein
MLSEKASKYAKVRHAQPCAGHLRLTGLAASKTWMAGKSPAMTVLSV